MSGRQSNHHRNNNNYSTQSSQNSQHQHQGYIYTPMFNNMSTSAASSNVAKVSIVCDRKRIISCTCTCSRQPATSYSLASISWCAHVVATALFRILEPHNVQYRTPITESLCKLDKEQLKKFALHLIAELVNEQILPTAQRLLDDLIQNADSTINQQAGAPDPTRGAFENDASMWCLDECVLQENIARTLAKFIMPSPNVVSDLECLEHTSSSAPAAEYTALLRPLRGREPEGMWNLVSIVREMFRRRDDNSVPLLRIMTVECLRIEQFVQLWFLVKSTQWQQQQHHHHHHHNDKALFNSVHSQRGLF